MNDIREMADEQLTQLNLNKPTTQDMTTETKTPKTRKSTREPRRTLPPVTLGPDATEEEAAAAFNTIVLRTPLAKQLFALEVGVPKKIDAELTRVKTAVKGFEKRYGAKFKLGKHPATGEVIIQRLAPPEPSTPADATENTGG